MMNEIVRSQRDGDTYYYNFHITHLDLLFCGTQSCYPGHSYGPSVRPYFLMVFIHSGKGLLRTQSREYHLEKGSTFFLFPGEITYYEADRGEPWEYSWVAFNSSEDVNNVEQLLLCSSISARCPVHVTAQYGELEELYRELIGFCQGGKQYVDIKIMSLFWDIIYQYTITANQTSKIGRHSPPLSDHVSIAIEYIKQYYDKSISVQMIADHVGITREHLCSLFKKQYGLSPVRFLRCFRMQNAATLLMTTEYSIDEISFLVGFSDYNYFTNLFHRMYGLSPTKYRKAGHEADSFPFYSERFQFDDKS